MGYHNKLHQYARVEIRLMYLRSTSVIILGPHGPSVDTFCAGGCEFV